MLIATCQSQFLFLGKKRNPGDVITAEELAKASSTARDALVSQKMIVLSEEGAPAQAAPKAQPMKLMKGEPLNFANPQLDRIEMMLTALCKHAGIDVDELAAKVKSEPPAKAKAAPAKGKTRRRAA